MTCNACLEMRLCNTKQATSSKCLEMALFFVVEQYGNYNVGVTHIPILSQLDSSRIYNFALEN